MYMYIQNYITETVKYCLMEVYYMEIYEKGSGDVVSAVCVQRDR